MLIASRTIKSLKNSGIALIVYFINLVLQFYSRKIFLEYLGTEILGLNTTVANLLQFLNLAELGIGAAVAYTLYKPLLANNHYVIIEIITLQGQIYRRIATFIICAAIGLMFFFPWIFEKMQLPIWYAYASFGVLLFSSLLSYFVNYKQVLLSADQKDYKIQYTYKTAMLVKVLTQIFAVRYSAFSYVWWLVLEGLFAIIGAIMLNRVIKKTYPYLQRSSVKYRKLRQKYDSIYVKIKQLFFHKIASFALNQTSPVIIYAYTSLTMVTLYGNYMLIIMGIISLMGAVFNSMAAGIGNLVAENNNERIIKVFNELFSIRFFITIVLCFATYILTPAFIALWIGKEYVMEWKTLALLVGILYINLSRYTVDAYLNAYGLFSDIWAPIVEAILNIGLSVLLGYLYGINGVLSGVLISLFLIVLGWKPYFLFRFGLKMKLRSYIIMYFKHMLIALIVSVGLFYAIKVIPIDPCQGVGSFILYSSISIFLFSIVFGASLCIADCGLKVFFQRIMMIKLY